MKTTHHISNAHCATSPLAVEAYCPIENANYRLIEERCIYFESKKLNYQAARSNCNCLTTGKLFEPTNDLINEKVHQGNQSIIPIKPRKHVKIPITFQNSKHVSSASNNDKNGSCCKRG